MRYITSILSLIAYKLNKNNRSKLFLKKSLSGKLNEKEPVLSVFIRTNEHKYLIDFLKTSEQIEQIYRFSLLARVFSNQKEYKKAFDLIKNIENKDLLPQQVKLSYILKDLDYLNKLNINNVDIFFFLDNHQKEKLINYLSFHDKEELTLRLINKSSGNHEELINLLETYSRNTLELYKWDPFKKNYLEIEKDPLPMELPSINQKLNLLDKRFKLIGHIHLINKFSMDSNYKPMLEKLSVPILNAEPSYFKYLEKEALENLQFNFEYEEKGKDVLSYYLDNYKQHPRETIDYFLKSLPFLPSHRRYSTFLSNALIDGVLDVENPEIKKWISRTNKNIEIFFDKDLFINRGVNESIDKYIRENLKKSHQEIIYKKVISQIVASDDLCTLPVNLVRYLDKNPKVFNIIVLWKHYLSINNNFKEENVSKNLDGSTLLKVYLYFAKLFFMKGQIHKSLDMTKKAHALSSINHQVFRNYIRIYNHSGNIRERFKYLQLMKTHYPSKIYGNEYEMAEQEYELLNHTWFPSIANNNIDSRNFKYENRVLFVLNKAYPTINGYTVRSDEIIQALGNLDFQPIISTKLGWSPTLEGDFKPKQYKNGYPVYYLDKVEDFLPYKTPIKVYFQQYTEEILEIIKSEQPNYIYAASNFQNALPSLAVGKSLDIPTIYEVRGMWQYTQSTKNPYFFESERFFLHEKYEIECCKLADRITCICESLKTYLVDRGIDENKIDIISNGVNTQELFPLEKNLELCEKYDLQNKVVVGFVGSITDYEGIDFIIDAIKYINENKLYEKEFAFLIVGDGKYKAVLQSKVVQLGMEKNILFLGKVPREQISLIYSLIDIAPFPRIDVPLCQLVTPLKPYEAMAFSKKVLVSDVDALKEMVIPNINGIIFKANDTKDLARALLEIVDNSSISSKARNWVINNKDWSVIGAQLKNVFEKMK